MRLSEKQALIMLDVLKWSLRLKNADGEIGWDYKTRNDLYDAIINQQSNIPKELDYTNPDRLATVAAAG